MQTNFSATPAELTLVSQIFIKADPQRQGTVTSDAAVRIFNGAKLSPVILSEIWNIANESKSSNLSRKEVAVAVRLIGWAQKGEKVTSALVARPGPLAVIEGINTVTVQNTGIPLPRSPPPSGTFPPLTPQDKTKFQNLFVKAGAVNGVLSGEKARDLFLKSKLSNEQLMMIWNLADTQDRGYLDAVDFSIGMYFIQGVMSNAISFIPTTLPPGLYQQAGGVTSTSSVQSHGTGTSGTFSPIRNSFGPQITGQTVLQVQTTGYSSPLFASPPPAPALPARRQTNGATQPVDWDVTLSEKASADRFFDSLDTQNKGYIEGDVAVPFMLKSQLPGEVLAQVWDLADIHQDGRLTRDGFAIAMHLIQKKLTGQDVPYTLPPSLIPPGLRASLLGPSPFSPATVPLHPEPVVDLVSFDDTPPPTAVQMQPIPLAGTVKLQAPGAIANTVLKGPAHLPWDNDPFSVPSQTSTQNFLDGDDHGNTSPALHDQSAEIGNVRNQLGSTEKSLSTAKQERQQLEQTLADQAAQLSTLQTQLSSAKAAYETEISLLSTLKDRRSAQITEIQKTREELIRAESDLSAIRVEKSEIEGVFLRDKEEARDLHRQMIEAGQQTESLKGEVEKLKKEAKQQRGLLAIARKQLSSKEAEKAKVEKEHEEAVAEVMSLNEETNAIEAEVASSVISSPTPKVMGPFATSSDMLAFAASHPLPATPDPSQPVRNNSNNPFAMSSGPTTPRSQSPFPGLQNPITSSPPPSINGAVSPPQASEDIFGIAEKKPTDKLTLSLPAAGFNLSDFVEGANTPVVPEGTASPTDYLTPPTTANPTSSIDSASSLAATSKFPALEDLSVTQKVSSPKAVAPNLSAQGETDLSSQLKDLDIETSDSSDDESSVTDEDSAPTAVTTTNGKVPPPADSGEVVKEVGPSKTAPPIPVKPTHSADLSFDAIFATIPAQSQGHVEEKDIPFDVFNPAAVQIKEPASPKPAEPANHIAGVSEFDQTFPTSWEVSSAPVNFSFENDFEETFNFNSAKADFPPVPIEPNTQEQSSTFDSIFTPSNVTVPSPTTVTVPVVALAAADGTSQPLSNGTKPNSQFDDIFGALDSALPTTENKPTGPTVPVAPSPPVATVGIQEDGSMPGAFPSQPGSPDTSRNSVEKEKTPPVRVASPKPRVSSSSSKETHEKPKEQTRHSKLSIRLPFGRKKKHQEPMPPPSHLSPPVEELRRYATTPANDDDVEAVKQLTGMGFSRSQAVEALEKYDYNVQRALNNLLGTR